MAEDERALEGYHYWGAVAFGILGSVLLWLALGEGLLVRVAWMPIALMLIGAMLLLPEPAASVVQVICAGAGYPVLFLMAGLMSLVPGGIAYTFSKTIVETFPRWLQVATLLPWFLALFGISLLLHSRAIRRTIREWIDAHGPEWLQNAAPNERVTAWLAVILYLNFVFIAAGCFAALAFLLHGLTPPLFLPKARPVEHGSLADFLLWHLLDAIPGLKVPETIKWEAPLTYERAGAGWLLLLFKIVVIVPVVSGIGHYLKDEDEKDSSEPAAAMNAPRGSVRPSD